ncbi:MAG: hypothetical protein QOE31_2944 [Solirubrobacteraceae bacterium]|jgi:hypothetical protein|nr:hypothetical protein [Solirubrobacteraceae bacterium]
MPAMATKVEHDDVAEALSGPSSHDARESLIYWRERLDGLPRRRRAARREAQAMVVAWEGRVRRAEIERWGGGMLGRFAASVVVLRTVRPRALARRAIGLVPRRFVVGVLTVVLGSVLLVGVLLGAVLSALL